jgi:hypothetical protein
MLIDICSDFYCCSFLVDIIIVARRTPPNALKVPTSLNSLVPPRASKKVLALLHQSVHFVLPTRVSFLTLVAFSTKHKATPGHRCGIRD